MKKIVRFLIYVFLSILYRPEFINTDNIPDKGGVLLCSNHILDLDMFFIGCRLKRFVHYMAKEELFRIPLVASFIRWAGAFPIKRGKADIGAIKTTLRLLDEGHIVGIFPEGTRIRGKDRKTVSIKRGAVMIAINAGVPIIPVGIKATYRPFSRVKVVYGKPFHLNADKEKKYTSEEMNEIAISLMDRVYELVKD